MFQPHLLIMKIYLVKGKMGRLIVMDNISGFTNKLLKCLCNMLIATKKTLKSSYLISISISKLPICLQHALCQIFRAKSKVRCWFLSFFMFHCKCWQNKKMRCKGICKSSLNFVAGWEEDTNELEPKPIHPEMQQNCMLKNKNTHQRLPVKKGKMQGQI